MTSDSWVAGNPSLTATSTVADCSDALKIPYGLGEPKKKKKKKKNIYI